MIIDKTISFDGDDWRMLQMVLERALNEMMLSEHARESTWKMIDAIDTDKRIW